MPIFFRCFSFFFRFFFANEGIPNHPVTLEQRVPRYKRVKKTSSPLCRHERTPVSFYFSWDLPLTFLAFSR